MLIMESAGKKVSPTNRGKFGGNWRLVFDRRAMAAHTSTRTAEFRRKTGRNSRMAMALTGLDRQGHYRQPVSRQLIE
jgi:hypothetical protein